MLGRHCHLLGQRGLVRSRLALGERGQRALVVLLLIVGIGIRRFRLIDGAPARVENLLARDLELDTVHFAQDCGRGETAVGIERGDEPAGDEVIHFFLGIGEHARRLSRGNDGMVVGDLRSIEDALRLRQFLADGRQVPDGLQVGLQAVGVILAHAVEYARTFGIDVVGEVLRVDAGIGGEFLLVKPLDELQRHIGREAVLPVAVDLQ